MKQTAYEVRMRMAEGYWRLYRFKEAVERARRVGGKLAGESGRCTAGTLDWRSGLGSRVYKSWDVTAR